MSICYDCQEHRAKIVILESRLATASASNQQYFADLMEERKAAANHRKRIASALEILKLVARGPVDPELLPSIEGWIKGHDASAASNS